MEIKDIEVSDTITVINQETSNSEEVSTNENIKVESLNGSSSEDSPVKSNTQAVFKRPGDPVSFDGSIAKRVKFTEEGRPLREIHSVIMTTSGFLSTAREGKLPEARTPQQERVESPPSPLPPPPVTNEFLCPTVSPSTKTEKKLKKTLKKTEDGKPENKENKKKKVPKDTLFQPDEIKNVKVKKSPKTGTKDTAKLKVLKTGTKIDSPNSGPSNISGK